MFTSRRIAVPTVVAALAVSLGACNPPAADPSASPAPVVTVTTAAQAPSATLSGPEPVTSAPAPVAVVHTVPEVSSFVFVGDGFTWNPTIFTDTAIGSFTQTATYWNAGNISPASCLDVTLAEQMVMPADGAPGPTGADTILDLGFAEQSAPAQPTRIYARVFPNAAAAEVFAAFVASSAVSCLSYSYTADNYEAITGAVVHADVTLPTVGHLQTVSKEGVTTYFDGVLDSAIAGMNWLSYVVVDHNVVLSVQFGRKATPHLDAYAIDVIDQFLNHLD